MAGTRVIDAIREKVGRLITDNRRLKEQCGKAVAQRDKLKARNNELETRISALEQRITVLELKKGFEGDSDNKKIARARVNRLMREVDKCIALLNR